MNTHLNCILQAIQQAALHLDNARQEALRAEDPEGAAQIQQTQESVGTLLTHFRAQDDSFLQGDFKRTLLRYLGERTQEDSDAAACGEAVEKYTSPDGAWAIGTTGTRFSSSPTYCPLCRNSDPNQACPHTLHERQQATTGTRFTLIEEDPLHDLEMHQCWELSHLEEDGSTYILTAQGVSPIHVGVNWENAYRKVFIECYCGAKFDTPLRDHIDYDCPSCGNSAQIDLTNIFLRDRTGKNQTPPTRYLITMDRDEDLTPYMVEQIDRFLDGDLPNKQAICLPSYVHLNPLPTPLQDLDWEVIRQGMDLLARIEKGDRETPCALLPSAVDSLVLLYHALQGIQPIPATCCGTVPEVTRSTDHSMLHMECGCGVSHTATRGSTTEAILYWNQHTQDKKER